MTMKCDFHKHRRQCQVPKCYNQVYARHLCVRHGGKRICAADGCHRNARITQHCAQHATSPVRTEMCTHVGCDHVAHLRHNPRTFSADLRGFLESIDLADLVSS
ncbi:hypothetical protein SPRG_16472 [Saprolegnia parasitica CBS 223.65]|uniref:Uncharacterized protein n=1 Tax=Saprolegnia parasitica (strain CBS 223.65) TaxID=695850 RepID=A0A067BT17_SAPPC|nr:hypothetical protein SPRG_16472 [Saprolegnia parasitica CBS 223.65]KDO17772.1 hypothetical protein SPRG_16472 [Saprolegnia parasitica CBS 223.65]|eukprot:XP_012211520.1 hypothetical protein SPRG_16472 [Saprolegnia parasitica CBS 223.65]